jgi:hypothetical protein
MAKKATCHTHNQLEENPRWTTFQKPYLKWETFLYLLYFFTYVEFGPTTRYTRPGPDGGLQREVINHRQTHVNSCKENRDVDISTALQMLILETIFCKFKLQNSLISD